MRLDIRERFIQEIKGRFPLSTLQVFQVGTIYYAMGWTASQDFGYWSCIQREGQKSVQWQMMTLTTLFFLIRQEATSREFLKPGTFSYETWESQGKTLMSCWARGNDDLLYHSLWLRTGECIVEWSAFLKIEANLQKIENNETSYALCKKKRGTWK